MVGTDIHLFRSFPKHKALQRPHSAPEPLAPAINSAQLQGHHRLQAAARWTASALGSPGNPLLDIRGLRRGAEAQINVAQCEAERLPTTKSANRMGSPQEQRTRIATRAASAGSLWLGQQSPCQCIDWPVFRRQILISPKLGAGATLACEQAAKSFAAFVQDELGHSKDSSPIRTSAKHKPARAQSELALPAILAATGRSRSRNDFSSKSNGFFFKEAQWHET